MLYFYMLLAKVKSVENKFKISFIQYEFGTIDRNGNPINLQPGQCIINIQLACLYHGVPADVLNPPLPPPPQLPPPNPFATLPNPIPIDMFHAQFAILNNQISIFCANNEENLISEFQNSLKCDKVFHKDCIFFLYCKNNYLLIALININHMNHHE